MTFDVTAYKSCDAKILDEEIRGAGVVFSGVTCGETKVTVHNCIDRNSAVLAGTIVEKHVKPIWGVEEELDCQECGACCIGGVLLTPKDVKRLPLAGRKHVKNNDGVRGSYFTLTEGRYCKLLEGVVGEKVSCSVYEQRPVVCRRMQMYSKECLSARRDSGLSWCLNAKAEV